MKAAATTALLLLAGCAAPSQPPLPPKPAADAQPTHAKIEIRTVPSGGYVSWNGDTLGPAPITIDIPTRSGYRWPAEDGALSQLFVARWLDGGYGAEVYISDHRIPEVIVIWRK